MTRAVPKGRGSRRNGGGFVAVGGGHGQRRDATAAVGSGSGAHVARSPLRPRRADRKRPPLTTVDVTVNAPSTKKRKRADDCPTTRRPAGASKWKFPDMNTNPMPFPPGKSARVPMLVTSRLARPHPRKGGSTKKAKHRNKKARVIEHRTLSENCTTSSPSGPTLPILDLSADLDTDLATFARFVSLAEIERAYRARVFKEIRGFILDIFPEAVVELYGSSSSGLETFRSDLDITVGNLDLTRTRDVARVDEESTAVAALDDHMPQSPSDDDDDDTASPGVDDNADDDSSFCLNLAIPGTTTSATRRTSNVRKPRGAASAPMKSPWNPTLRRLKLRQLRALQQIILFHRPQYKIKCLNKAKIPILMIVDKESGLNIDIGVNREAFESSDHGRTTALVTELQRNLGAPFTSIVTFLKEFLHQFDLDKPFTGGLGSYRLYMMVAYIVMTRLSAHARPPPSVVLLTFLEVFGNRRKPGFLCSTTELPIRHGDHMDIVEFSAVFRLEDCIEKFAMAFDIIAKHRRGGLGGVVYEEKLQVERAECLKRIHHQCQSQNTEDVPSSSHVGIEADETSDASDIIGEISDSDDDEVHR